MDYQSFNGKYYFWAYYSEEFDKESFSYFLYPHLLIAKSKYQQSLLYMKTTTAIINEAIYFSDIQTLPISTLIFRGVSHTCLQVLSPTASSQSDRQCASCFDLYQRSCQALIEEDGMQKLNKF